MKAGEAKVGQRVRTKVRFAAYPTVKVGSSATVVRILAQHPGAETDALLIQPESWAKNLAMPCQSKDVELIAEGS